MARKLWKGRLFLLLSALATFTLIMFFFVGVGSGNQALLKAMYYLILILGIASLIMGVWSFLSKLATQKATIFAAILTILNVLIFLYLF